MENRLIALLLGLSLLLTAGCQSLNSWSNRQGLPNQYESAESDQ